MRCTSWQKQIKSKTINHPLPRGTPIMNDRMYNIRTHQATRPPPVLTQICPHIPSHILLFTRALGVCSVRGGGGSERQRRFIETERRPSRLMPYLQSDMIHALTYISSSARDGWRRTAALPSVSSSASIHIKACTFRPQVPADLIS